MYFQANADTTVMMRVRDQDRGAQRAADRLIALCITSASAKPSTSSTTTVTTVISR